MKVIYNQSLKDVSEWATLDVLRKELLKFFNLVDLGTKAKFFKIYFFQIKFTFSQCIQFDHLWVYSSQKKIIAFLVKRIKHAQFIHLEKRNEVGSTSEVGSNLGVKIAKALWNCCTKKSFKCRLSQYFSKYKSIYDQSIINLSQKSFRFN